LSGRRDRGRGLRSRRGRAPGRGPGGARLAIDTPVGPCDAAPVPAGGLSVSRRNNARSGAGMRAIKTAGLAFAAAALSCALLASGALAGEYGHCAKTERAGHVFKGQYLDKGCTKKATIQETQVGGTENKWDWESGAGPAPALTAKGKAVTLQLSGEAGSITCERHTSTGQVTSSKEASMQITFSGCTWSVSGESCESAGQLPGWIVWPVFDRLVDHGEHGHGGGEPAEGEVWSELTVFPNAEFTCGAQKTSFVVFDSVAGVTSGKSVNAMAKKDATAFGTGKGEQNLELFFANPSTSKLERLHATLTAEDAAKFEERIEVRL